MFNNPMVLWALVLLGVAGVLLIIEVFVPSGGVIGFVAFLCAIAALVIIFGIDTTAGLTATILMLLAVPFLIGFAIKLWPNTPIGRALTLQNRQKRLTEENESRDGETQLEIGATGEALTDLRPVGTCRFYDQRKDCLAATGVILSGTKVRVTSIDGIQIKVTKAD